MSSTDPHLGAPANPFLFGADELAWLKAHPEFDERPATLEEFLGPGYLNIREYVRKRILVELREIIGDTVSAEKPTRYPYAIITGGIGIGKTTVASIVLPYLAHWLLCLHDPQKFFGLMPGSRIALMQMSTSESQALQVIFQDVKARINHAPWFRKWPPAPDDAKFKNQIRFSQKDIWIIPGDSAETTFEGYNIFGGILDEADSHKVTPNKDYAEQGFSTIDNRIGSRFEDKGFLLVIGQKKSAQGFAARKYEEFMLRDDAYAVSLAIWESMGDDHYEKDAQGVVKKFTYDVKRKKIVPNGVSAALGHSDNFIKVPVMFLPQFKSDPVKALRDLAGMPPHVTDPFIALPDKIEAARERWKKRYPGRVSPVTPEGRIVPGFRAPDTIKRAVHLDIAYAEGGDSYGIAMGHVPEVIDVEGELKPLIVFDLLMRWKAPPHGEIFLADVRKFLYALKDDCGFNIHMVTMDGFESVETRQQLKRRRFRAEELSVDKQVGPYHDLREALYEDRLAFPEYLTPVRQRDGSSAVIEIVYKEMTELVDDGRKIDHPLNGSKDVTDAMAGVVFTLMGDRRYRRLAATTLAVKHRKEYSQSPLRHPAFKGDFGSVRAPLPPAIGSFNDFG